LTILTWKLRARRRRGGATRGACGYQNRRARLVEAGRVAEASGGVVEPLAKSEGFKVTVMEGKTAIVARIKSTGEMRVSVAGKAGMTAKGNLSSDRALTHFENLSSQQLNALIDRARELVRAMRQ
jgi:hypothetical protein